MFDFEKLQVYQKSKLLNRNLNSLIKNKRLDYVFSDQLKRASLSILLNIAEGSGKLSNKDKRNYYFRARGSLYECAAIIDILNHESIVSNLEHDKCYVQLEEISKMLYGLISSMKI
ncbi:four helix bundle protein [Candidatus Dojkabacteria bacterium]|uniref:Four helix bundle protein n=1 Tax=Candidatus Dojkabacteria bacterium TaxID=2099670 RepID=A0A955RGE8_9BACT|nr:four helix bundle protein [Candidatus Dojkabacteria bacterium]